MANIVHPAHGFSRQGLALFNEGFHKLVDDGELPNIVTLVSRHGEIVNLDAYGVQDISGSPPVPVKADSIFRIASMTKPVTGVALMILYEEGKFKLEDPIAKHIPEFEGLKVKQPDGSLVEQESPMNMAQLMSHTAGFGKYSEYPDSMLRNGVLQDMINTMAQYPLSFQPGKDWRYGTSVDVQGYLIEKLSGKGLDEFFEKRLFKPLGMPDTGFWVPASKVDRVVRIHRYNDKKQLIPSGDKNVIRTSKPDFLSGGGGLVSTITDYWHFSQALLNGGELDGKRILKPETVKLLHTNVLEPGVNVTLYSPETRGLGFGLDFAIVQDPAAAKSSQGVQSYYWGGAFGTWFWIDPVKDLIVIGFIQMINGTTPDGAPSVREASAKAVYAALQEPVANGAP